MINTSVILIMGSAVQSTSLQVTTTESKDQVERRFLLDVVVTQGATIFKLLAGKDQPLLIWRNSLLVLDFGFDILNGVRGLHFEGDGLACEGLDEDLHATSKPKNQMQSRFFLNIVVTQGATILKLLAGKDQPLLIWGDSLLVLDLGFNILNGV